MNKVILHLDNDLCDIRAELEDEAPGVPIIHMTMKSWGKRERQLWDFVWGQFKLALHEMGYTSACAVVPEENDKLYRFSMMSGMQEAFRANGHILMRTEV